MYIHEFEINYHDFYLCVITISFRLFVPVLGPFVSKAGEAFNEVPLFVRDFSCERGLSRAKERYELYLEIEEARHKKGEYEALQEGEVKKKDYNGASTDWIAVPSRSRPGKTSYKNVKTGEVVQTLPLDLLVVEEMEETRRQQIEKIKKAFQEETDLWRAEHPVPELKEPSRQQEVVDKRYKNYGPTPFDWIAVPSRSRPGEISYENVKTGEVIQRHPLDPVYQKRAKEEETQRRLEIEEAKKKANQPQEAPQSVRVRDHHDLPPGWIAVPSRSRPGEMSYRNEKTRQVMRVHPMDWTRSTDPEFIKWRDTKLEEEKAAQSHMMVKKDAESLRGAESVEVEKTYKNYGFLPPEWFTVPSRSRPGEISYENAKTGEVSHRHPLDPVYLKRMKEKEKEMKKEKLLMLTNERKKQQQQETNRWTVATSLLRGLMSSGKGRNAGKDEKAQPYSEGATMSQAADSSVHSPNRNRDKPLQRKPANSATDVKIVSYASNSTRNSASTRGRKGRDGRLKLEDVSSSGSNVSRANGTMMKSGRSLSSRSILSRNQSPAASRTLTHVGSPRITNAFSSADDHHEAPLSIFEWVENIGPGNGNRFGPIFNQSSISTFQELLDLDDSQFMALEKKLKADRQKADCKKLARVLEVMRDTRNSAATKAQQEHFADDDRDEHDEESGFDEDDKAPEPPNDAEHQTERGIYFLTFDAKEEEYNDLSFHEARRCWIIEVRRPRDEIAQIGEGMLLWFDSYSSIGYSGGAGEDSSASVRFMEYRKEESEVQEYLHAKVISASKAHFLFDFNPLFKRAQFGRNYAGTPGDNMPSRTKPLFVPKMIDESGLEYFTCALCLNHPRGTEPAFTLRSCYIGEAPLVGVHQHMRRRVKWALYVMLFIATDIIVMTTGGYQAAGIYLFLFCATAVSLFEAAEVHTEHKDKYGGALADAFDFLAHFESITLLWHLVVGWFCGSGTVRTDFTRRASELVTSPGSVRPVLDPAIDVGSRPDKAQSSGTKPSSVDQVPIRPVDEREQLAIYKRITAMPLRKGTVDKVIAEAVKKWKKADNSLKLSEACRGLVSPSVCSKVIADTVKADKVMLNHYKEVLLKRLSDIHFKVCREYDERRHTRDMLYGPESSLDIFKRQLGLVGLERSPSRSFDD